MQDNTSNIINITTMCQRLNKGRTTLWCWVRDNRFPQPLRVGQNTLGWTEAQYVQWLKELEATNHG